MLRISKYVFYDIIRNRVSLAYTAFLLLVSLSLFQMEENPSRALLSLLNIILIVVPLISLVFSTIHWYNSYEFIELLLTQPVSRKKVLWSEYSGVAASLVLALVVGLGLPLALYQFNKTGFALLLISIFLTFIFTALAFWASIKAQDKARGIGYALLLWFYFTLIYDGLVLLILFSFADYPMEKATLLLSSLNPIDLGRIFLMLQLDISALMGYTGALYKDFFGSGNGVASTLGILFLWMLIPSLFALRAFTKKDL